MEIESKQTQKPQAAAQPAQPDQPTGVERTPHKKVDADALASMSTTEIFAALASDSVLASDVARFRPSIVGELLQMAFAQTRPGIALALVGALRHGMLRGDPAALLFRSVLRLQGPGAADVQSVLGSIIQEEHSQKKSKPIPLIESDTDPSKFDFRDDALDAAKRDPAWGKLVADFHDRPEAAAAQLLEEAKQDPRKFKKHASQLSGMIASSPSAARFFVHAVMQLKGEHASDVRLMVLGEMHQAVAPDIAMRDRGLNDMRDGGPQQRAERLIPLMAEMLSQPDVADALVNLNRSGGSMPAALPHLPHLLREVLDYKLSKSVQKQVRSSLNSGAAEMLHTSLVADDPMQRKAQTVNAANFIGHAACAERDVGIEKSFVKSVGEMLVAASKIIPGPASQPASLAGDGLKAIGKDSKPQITSRALDHLTRMVYQTVHGVADGPTGDSDRQRYEFAYVSWQSDAANEFARMERCK